MKSPAVLASTEGLDIARLLLDLLIVLGVAVLFGEIAERAAPPCSAPPGSGPP